MKKNNKNEKINVLFLCTGNSARSQMAEAFLRKYAGGRYAVYSAGLQPSRVHPLTLQVMEELGIDMSDHRSKHVQEYIGKIRFGYVITVCGHADKNCPFIPGMGTRLHWAFDDPAAAEGSEEERLAKFRQVRDEIKNKILDWVPVLS